MTTRSSSSNTTTHVMVKAWLTTSDQALLLTRQPSSRCLMLWLFNPLEDSTEHRMRERGDVAGKPTRAGSVIHPMPICGSTR
jgi:hypothetical protein